MNAPILSSLKINLPTDSGRLTTFVLSEPLSLPDKAQGAFKCGACGHLLDQPRLENSAILCEKCGKAALSLEEG
jgi:Zn finger protein HypA/HybF involved in hydrogenase expression